MQARLTLPQRMCYHRCHTIMTAHALAGFADGAEAGWEWGCLHGALRTLTLLVHRVPSMAEHAAEVVALLHAVLPNLH